MALRWRSGPPTRLSVQFVSAVGITQNQRTTEGSRPMSRVFGKRWNCGASNESSNWQLSQGDPAEYRRKRAWPPNDIGVEPTWMSGRGFVLFRLGLVRYRPDTADTPRRIGLPFCCAMAASRAWARDLGSRNCVSVRLSRRKFVRSGDCSCK